MQSKKNNQRKYNTFHIITGVLAILILVVAAFSLMKPKGTDTVGNVGATASTITESGDLVIPLSSIGDDASFYQYDKLKTDMEILAVKASDGSLRTAFNTCQVCYSSGRGYYVQEGNFLICQNCGNRFGMDDIGIKNGGCNPVPILDEQRQVDGESITITKELLTQAEEIFANWKL